MSASTVTFHRLYGCLCSITIKHEQRKSVELANVWNKEKAPVLGDRGLTDRRRGVGGCGDYLPSELGRWRLRCRCLLIQSQRITTILQLRDGVIGDRKSLLLGQPFFQTSNDLPGTPKCEGNGVAKNLTSCHAQSEHIENKYSSRYILRAFCEGATTARRPEGYSMCGRFTVKATWAELVALYRLTTDAPPHNLRPRYNVCPTDPVDVVTAAEEARARPDALGPDPEVVEQNH